MTMSIATDRPVLTNAAEHNQTVARFWNKISRAWSMIWGPHIHHGYYEANEQLSPLKAQERLIEKLFSLLPSMQGINILDVGCGLGGSSIHLAERYDAQVLGVTLSSEQVNMARRRAQWLGAQRVHFQIEDALSLRGVPSESVDLVWSLESCEQFFDKDRFLKQACRVLKPGGRLMLATWCSTQPRFDGESAKAYQHLCEAFDVPYMPTMLHYLQLLERNHFRVEKLADWSREVAPSWNEGLALIKPHSFWRLLRLGGWRGWRFAKQVRLMRDAFANQHVCYGVFIAEKLPW